MPGGASSPAVGYLVFGGIKFAGYSLAARSISKRYQRTDRNAYAVGGTRTLIGMMAGALYIGLLSFLPQKVVATGGLVFLAGLLPMRIAEWWLLLWLFYDRGFARKQLGCASSRLPRSGPSPSTFPRSQARSSREVFGSVEGSPRTVRKPRGSTRHPTPSTLAFE